MSVNTAMAPGSAPENKKEENIPHCLLTKKKKLVQLYNQNEPLTFSSNTSSKQVLAEDSMG